jgi:Flp pilus assembly pilin Flp
MRLIMKLLREESGDTGIEYGLVAAIFAVGAVAVLQLVGVLHTPWNIRKPRRRIVNLSRHGIL